MKLWENLACKNKEKHERIIIRESSKRNSQVYIRWLLLRISNDFAWILKCISTIVILAKISLNIKKWQNSKIKLNDIRNQRIFN